MRNHEVCIKDEHHKVALPTSPNSHICSSVEPLTTYCCEDTFQKLSLHVTLSYLRAKAEFAQKCESLNEHLLQIHVNH
jgi:hypothetical protein